MNLQASNLFSSGDRGYPRTGDEALIEMNERAVAVSRFGLLSLVLLLTILAMTATACETATPEPYPQSHLQLLGVYADAEGSEPVSLFDFGTVTSGYSRDVLIPVYVKNRTDQRLEVTADKANGSPGSVSLEPAPPKYDSERHVDPGNTEKFHLVLDLAGTTTAQEYAFEVTVAAEWGEGGGFDTVFPARLTVVE